MSLADPLAFGNGQTGTNGTLSKIVAKAPNTTSYKRRFSDGAVYQLDFQQNGNKSRSRHFARLTYTKPGAVGTPAVSHTMSLIIDEPADGTVLPEHLLVGFQTFRATMTDSVINAMVAGEV